MPGNNEKRAKKVLHLGPILYKLFDDFNAPVIPIRIVTDKMKITLRIAALFCLQFAAIAQPIQTQLVKGHVPPGAANLTALGRLEAGRELKLAIGLPLRNKEGLTNLLQRIYDPASSDYHHFLTPAQFAEKFGPTEEDYRAVTEFAKANGLRDSNT